MTAADLGFLTTTLTLRPPRVAIMFRAGDRWRDWAMTALAHASERWGGGGFIFVPYDSSTGEPDPAFAPIVRAYDPDHVVILEVPGASLEEWHPGEISFRNVPDEESRSALIKSSEFPFMDPRAGHARETVASWCSPLRMAHWGDEQGRSAEISTTLARHEPASFSSVELPTRLRVESSPENAILAASEAWRSDAGLLAAMTLGVAPNEQEGRPEPSEHSLRWLLDRDNYQPGVELQTTPFEEGSSPKSLFAADQGLDEVFRGHTPFVGAVVIGDTAADFALALAYDRMLGFGIWVGPELQETWQQVTRPTLHRRFVWLRRSARKLSVLSCSMSDEEVSELTTELSLNPPSWFGSGEGFFLGWD